MKYKINQSRLYTLASQFLLSELGGLNIDGDIGELEVFEKDGVEMALLIYLPQSNSYLLKIDDDLYDKTMNLFLLDLEEMGEILTKLIYDLTGANVEMIQTFDR
jgi:hypothetical protein